VKKKNTVALRCNGTLHGHVTDNRWLEVKCKRRICGWRKGTILLHTIDLQTGKVVSSRQFREPGMKKEGQHDADCAPTAVRTS
jgi:hypothetical protein